MIRWKAFIPVSILLAVFCLGYIFFIDTIIKKVIIKTGQGIFGAKVEVSGVDLSLKNSSLNVSGLYIANKEDPWKNLIEAKSIKMDIQTLPLLSKKVIIDELSAEGISWGTKRKTSGFLQEEKKEKKKKKEKEEKKSSAISLPFDKLSKLGKNVDVKSLIDPDNLAAVKQAKVLKADISGKKEKWQKEIAQFDEYKKKLENIQNDIEAVEKIKVKSIKDVPDAKNKIKKLKEAKDALNDMKKKVSKTRTSISEEAKFVKNNIGNLDKIKKQDYKDIMKNLGFGDISTSSIGNAIFGPIIMKRISTVIKWIDKIKSHLPKKKDKKAKKPERKRLKGRDILFPKRKGMPAFLVKKMSFSAASAPESEKKLELSGNVTNITSNPALLGKPVKFVGKGEFKDMLGSKLWVNGVLDYTKEVSKENLKITVKGVDLKDMSWSGGEYVPSGFEKGTGTVKAVLTRSKEKIDCSIDAAGNKISFKSIEKNDKAGKIMNDIFQSVDMLTVKGNISGVPPGDLDVSLKSNLDKIISQKIKKIFGEELEAQKAKVKKEIDAIVNAKKKELLDDLSKQQKEITEKLTGTDGLIQEKLGLAKKSAESKENEIKNISDQKKKEGTKKIQENLQKNFKKLFK